MKKRLKRILTALLAGSMLITAAAACSSNNSGSSTGGDGSQAGTTGEKKHIVWLTESYQDNETEGIEKYILEPAKEALPDIEVEWQTSADHRQVLKVQMAAGEGPDIFLLDGPAVAQEYYVADRLLDLTPYSEKYGWKDKFFSWALKCGTFDDKLYAVPVSYEGIVWWYNETLLEEKGWEMPTNRADFEKFCQTAQDDGMIPMAYGASNIKIANDWIMTQYIGAVCGKEETQKVLTGEKKWTDEPMRSAFEMIVKDWQAGWIGNKQSQSISQDDATALLYQRQAATKPEGSWLYANIQTAMDSGTTDDTIAMTLFPSFIEGEDPVFPLGIGAAYCVNGNTKYPDECLEFLQYMMIDNIENHAKQVVEYGWQPAPINTLNDYLPEDSMPALLQDLMTTMDGAIKAENINYVAYTFWPSETRNYFNDNIEKVYLDMMSLDDFLAGMQEVFDKAKDAGMLLPIPE